MDFTSQCSHSRPSAPTRLSVFVCRYQGHIGSSLIVGGVDVDGAHLYSVYPHGSYDKLPYLAMGTSAHQHLAGVSAVQLSVRPSCFFVMPLQFQIRNQETLSSFHPIRSLQVQKLVNLLNF